MSFAVQVLPSDQLAVVRLPRSLTGDTVASALGAVLGSPVWEPTFRIVWDWRDVREAVVTPDEVGRVQRLAQRLACRMGAGRTAVVARRDEDLVTATLFNVVTHRDPLRERKVFRCPVAAADWLGVPQALLARP